MFYVIYLETIYKFLHKRRDGVAFSEPRTSGNYVLGLPMKEFRAIVNDDNSTHYEKDIKEYYAGRGLTTEPDLKYIDANKVYNDRRSELNIFILRKANIYMFLSAMVGEISSVVESILISSTKY